MKNELINVEAMGLKPASLFVTGGLEELLGRIETEARALVPDTSSAKGRKEIASNAARIPRSKAYLDGLGKRFTADLKKQTAVVDRERRGMRDRLDTLKTEVRLPLTQWEEAEQLRVTRLQARLSTLSVEIVNEEGVLLSSAGLREQRDAIAGIEIDDSWQGIRFEAAEARAVALVRLDNAIAERVAYEADQMEISRLRKETEERERADRDEKIRREAADKARREAEQAAANERTRIARAAATERREAEKAAEETRRKASEASDAKLARADSDKREAQQRAYRAENETKCAAKTERDRIEAAHQNEIEAARKREDDTVHREAVEGAIISALMDFGLAEELAGTVVVAIRLGQIPNVGIQY